MCRPLVRSMALLRRYCAACGCTHKTISNHWKQFTVRDAQSDDPEAAIHKDTLKVYHFGSTVYILADHHDALKLPPAHEPCYICLRQYNIITSKKQPGAVEEPQQLDPPLCIRSSTMSSTPRVSCSSAQKQPSMEQRSF